MIRYMQTNKEILVLKCIQNTVLKKHYPTLLQDLDMKYISPYLLERGEISEALESNIRSRDNTERSNLASEFVLNIASECEFDNVLYSLNMGGYDYIAKMLYESYVSVLQSVPIGPTRCLDYCMAKGTFLSKPYYELKRQYDNGDAVTKEKYNSLLDNLKNPYDRIFYEFLFRSLIGSYNGESAEQEKFYSDLKLIVPSTSNPQLAHLLLPRHRSFTMLHLRRKMDSDKAMEHAWSEIVNLPMCREKVEILCGICLNRLESSTPAMSCDVQKGLYDILQDIAVGYWNLANEMEDSEYKFQKNIVEIVRCLVAMKITAHGEEISLCGITPEDINKSKQYFIECEKNGILQHLTKKWQIVITLARTKIALLEMNAAETEYYLQNAIRMADEIPFLPFLKDNINHFIRVYWDVRSCPLSQIFAEPMEM